MIGAVGEDAAAHNFGNTLKDADETGAGTHDDGNFTAHRTNGKKLYQA